GSTGVGGPIPFHGRRMLPMETHLAGQGGTRDAGPDRGGRPRVKPAARVACESLEGRQLLSRLGGHLAGERLMAAHAAHGRAFPARSAVHIRAGGQGHRGVAREAVTPPMVTVPVSPPATPAASTATTPGASTATTPAASTAMAAGLSA